VFLLFFLEGFFMKKLMLFLLIGFYLFAGINHFINADFYKPLLPLYLKDWSIAINFISGIAEIILGLLMLFSSTRKLAAYGIIVMLIAFIPAHIYMIQQGTFSLGSFEMTPMIGWVRLLIIHPLLMYWTWSCRR
jgi:uncharacterized membrane protein